MNVQASILLPAGAAVGVALPQACDHVSREFQPVGRRAYRAVSHSRWRCASVRCCSAPRRFESNARRLPWLAVCPAGGTPILAICASAPACHSIADSRATFVHGSSYITHCRRRASASPIPRRPCPGQVGANTALCDFTCRSFKGEVRSRALIHRKATTMKGRSSNVAKG
jgi:hypothetical protein